MAMLRNIWSSCLLPVSLYFSVPEQAAQTGADVESDEQICVAIRIPWNATIAETTAIIEQPIPATYLARLHDGETCAPGAPSDELTQWHLQFGSETSTLAALQFIASRQYRDSPEGDIHLAQIAVMAADFWRSQRLLNFSRRYVQATERWLALAQRSDGRNDMAPGSTMDGDDVKRWAPDIILRATVAKAELSGDRRDFDSAVELVQQYTPVDFLSAARLAYGSGDDFCDWGTGWIGAEGLAQLSERCEEFEAAGPKLWDFHARLSFSPFAPASRPGSPLRFATDRAASFLTRQRQNDNIATGSRAHYDEIYRLVALFVSDADARFRLHRAAHDLDNAADQAQYPLARAIPWISAADHPNLFRRVATRYLELDALARSDRPVDARRNPRDDRYVNWLREEVALLDRHYGERRFAPVYAR